MNALEELRRSQDVDELRAKLLEISAPFGAVQRLDVLISTHEERQQAICFMRLASPEQERAFMKSIGVGRFGGEIVLVVDLPASEPEEDNGPLSRWSEFGPM